MLVGAENNFNHEFEPNRRVEQFIGDLASIERTDVIEPDIDLDDSDPVEFAKKRFLTYQFDGTQTLYLDPCLLTDTGAPDSPPTFTPLVARGGGHSAHGVFFGTLSIGEEELNVAVKPQMAEPFSTGLNDYFKTSAVRQMNFRSLKPVAMLLPRNEDGSAYSVTELELGLTTIDSIDWSSYYPEMSSDPGMQEIWRVIADRAAILHNAGNMSHGDMAARNIATTADNETFFIDWELARISGDPPRDAESRYQHSYTDLSVLLESICLPPMANIGGKNGIGILYGKDGDWWQAVKDIFFDRYESMRKDLAENGSHSYQTEREVKEEITVLEHELKKDAEMMRQICQNI